MGYNNGMKTDNRDAYLDQRCLYEHPTWRGVLCPSRPWIYYHVNIDNIDNIHAYEYHSGFCAYEYCCWVVDEVSIFSFEYSPCY